MTYLVCIPCPLTDHSAFVCVVVILLPLPCPYRAKNMTSGASIEMWKVKPPPMLLASRTSCSISYLAPGKQAWEHNRQKPKDLDSCHHVGDLGAVGTWLWPGSAPAIWSKPADGRSLHVFSFPPVNSAFQTNTSFLPLCP